MKVNQFVLAALAAAMVAPSVTDAQVNTTATPATSTSEIGAAHALGCYGIRGVSL